MVRCLCFGLKIAITKGMKSSKHAQQTKVELELQPVVSQAFEFSNAGNTSSLEFILTNAAFGFEYALKELEESGEYGFHAERIRSEMDTYKQAYFEARNKLQELDELKLICVEEELRLQKMIVFSGQNYVQ